MNTHRAQLSLAASLPLSAITPGIAACAGFASLA